MELVAEPDRVDLAHQLLGEGCTPGEAQREIERRCRCSRRTAIDALALARREWAELAETDDEDAGSLRRRLEAMMRTAHRRALEAEDFGGAARIQRNMLILHGVDGAARRTTVQVAVDARSLPSVAGNYGLPSEGTAQPVDVRTEAAAEPVPTGDE